MKEILWIEVEETIKRAVGLEIGKDITSEAAIDLLKLDGGDYGLNSEEYCVLDGHLGTDAHDTDGFKNVTCFIKAEK